MATLPTARTATLTVTISGQDYRVRPIRPEVPGILRAWRLRKVADGSAYDVARYSDHLGCTCGDYQFRRHKIDPHGCKHCRALVAVGLLDPIPEAREEHNPR